MNAILILSGIGVFAAGFVVGVLFSMYFTDEFYEDLSKPNSENHKKTN